MPEPGLLSTIAASEIVRALACRLWLKFVVPMATAILGRTQDPHLAKRRRFQRAKAAIAFFFVVLLMSIGLQGRQHARLQGRLQDITLVRDQLQQKLDDEPRSIEPFVGVPGTDANASRPPLSNPQIRALVGAMRLRLEKFDSDYGSGKLSGIESLEIRLSKATLATAEQRFADVLTMITDEDEKRESPSSDAQIGRCVRVLQI